MESGSEDPADGRGPRGTSPARPSRQPTRRPKRFDKVRADGFLLRELQFAQRAITDVVVRNISARVVQVLSFGTPAARPSLAYALRNAWFEATPSLVRWSPRICPLSHKNFTRAKMERRLAQIEESVARYLSQLDTADRQEPSEALATKTAHLKEKLAAWVHAL
jgi:hypothetical protein